MSKHIHRHYIKPHTTPWFAFRSRGYGASEVAGVLAEYHQRLADFVWSDPIKIHLDKIGEPIQQFNGNVASEAGKYQERNIVEMYKYWDNDNPDAFQMYQRLNAGGKRLNRVRCPKVYLSNDKYPWLFSSPDGFEYQNGKPVGILECKLTTSFDANRYPNRISPSFVLQVMQSLMISELEYAKICILIDGQWLEVITIYPDQTQFDMIVECTQKSWLRVLKCREVKKAFGIDVYYGLNPDIAPKSWTQETDVLDGLSPLGYLQSAEPDFSGSDSEYKFVAEHFPPTTFFTERDGTDEEFDLLLERKGWAVKKDEADTNIRRIDTELTKSMAGFHQINFPEMGYYSRKPDKNGTVRPYVSPKLYQ